MYKLCNNLALDAIQTCGVTRVQSCIVVPMATGMTMSLYLLLLRQERPNANLVIWPRIDQKTCLKCISTSGLTPVVIANVLKGDEIVTNVAAIREAITTHGAASILQFLLSFAEFVVSIDSTHLSSRYFVFSINGELLRAPRCRECCGNCGVGQGV